MSLKSRRSKPVNSKQYRSNGSRGFALLIEAILSLVVVLAVSVFPAAETRDMNDQYSRALAQDITEVCALKGNFGLNTLYFRMTDMVSLCLSKLQGRRVFTKSGSFTCSNAMLTDCLIP